MTRRRQSPAKSICRPDTSSLGAGNSKTHSRPSQAADRDTDFAVAGVCSDLCLLQFAPEHADDYLQHPDRARRKHNVPVDFGIPFERPGDRWIYRGFWRRRSKRDGDGVIHKQVARSGNGAARCGRHRRERPAAGGVVERVDREHQPDPLIVSSGTGAEIEKPLAIVVVGGLITRPIKIVVLPMVYEWVERRAARRAERRAEAAPA